MLSKLLEERDFEFAGSVGNSALEDVGSPARIVLGGGYRSVGFEVANEGQALANFAILVQFHKDGEWHILIGGDDWANTAISIKPFVSATPKTLASGSAVGAIVVLGPVYAIKFQAQASSGTTDVVVRGHVWRV